MLRRLHWGCGPITPYGWVNSDIEPGPGVDVVADIRAGLPLPDNAFDYIVSIHTLPELSYADQDRALAELRRVLRPGGVLRLSLPDFDKAIQAYTAKDIDYFLIPDEAAKTLSGKMIVQLLWYGRSRCLFTPEFTIELLERCGYQSIKLCAFRLTASEYPGIIELDDRELESFFVEARK
ncbi:MAG: class I SAM-dependent methyltransferase [Planctomycetia bacterium]|nr:class I SAM-dependent methyltransferase [Planctomycetia bacterium]